MSDRVSIPPAREITKDNATLFVVDPHGVPQPYDDDQDDAGYVYETFQTLDGKSMRIAIGRRD